MFGIKAWLEGKKVYLLGLSAIIGAITAYMAGTVGEVEAVTAIWAALTAMAMRAGITKSGPTP